MQSQQGVQDRVAHERADVKVLVPAPHSRAVPAEPRLERRLVLDGPHEHAEHEGQHLEREQSAGPGGMCTVCLTARANWARAQGSAERGVESIASESICSSEEISQLTFFYRKVTVSWHVGL